jgi:salicylate hydroxylase
MEEIMTKTNTMQTNELMHMRRYDTGKILRLNDTNQSLKDYGFPIWSMSRYRLQETLCEVAVEKGVNVLFGKTAVGVDLEKPSITLKNGEVLKADLIIGSDGMLLGLVFQALSLTSQLGIRSIIRDAIVGTTVKSISPLTAYNIDIPRSFLKKDPSLSHLLTEFTNWLGPKQIVVALNMPDMGDSYNIYFIRRTRGKRA